MNTNVAVGVSIAALARGTLWHTEVNYGITQCHDDALPLTDVSWMQHALGCCKLLYTYVVYPGQ